jgi:hypothetical protein
MKIGLAPKYSCQLSELITIIPSFFLLKRKSKELTIQKPWKFCHIDSGRDEVRCRHMGQLII